MAPRAHHWLALGNARKTAFDNRLGCQLIAFDQANEGCGGEAVRFGVRHGAILGGRGHPYLRTSAGPCTCPNLTHEGPSFDAMRRITGAFPRRSPQSVLSPRDRSW